MQTTPLNRYFETFPEDEEEDSNRITSLLALDGGALWLYLYVRNRFRFGFCDEGDLSYFKLGCLENIENMERFDKIIAVINRRVVTMVQEKMGIPFDCKKENSLVLYGKSPMYQYARLAELQLILIRFHRIFYKVVGEMHGIIPGILEGR